MVPSPVNLALLICDELPLSFTHGTTAEIYQRWLDAAYPPEPDVLLPRPKITPYDVRGGIEKYPDAEELCNLDAVMITGSRADAFKDEYWIHRLVCFIQHILNKYNHIRVFGICFGHQIIARALGGIVKRNEKWEYGLTAIRVTPIGKLIFGVERLFELQQIHQDHVPLTSLSDHFSSGSIYLLGSSTRTNNQGFVQFYEHCKECEAGGKVHKIHDHIRIMTFQGHPEFTEAIVIDLVRTWVKSGRIPEDYAQTYFAEGDTPADPPEACHPKHLWPYEYDGINVVGRAFWKVLGVKYDNAAKVADKDASSPCIKHTLSPVTRYEN